MLNWRNNITAKILSLVAAICLWVYIINEENPVTEVTYKIPVAVQNLHTEYLVENVPEEVRVRLRGPRNSLLALNESTMKAVLDLQGLKPGQQQVEIKFIPPSSIYVDNMTPNLADIIIDEYATREIPVEFKSTGQVAKDMLIKEVKVSPQTITVTGAKRIVDQARKAMVSAQVGDKKESFTATSALSVVDGNGRELQNLSLSVLQGQVEVQLERNNLEKSAGIVPEIIGNPQAGFVVGKIEVEPKEIKVSGLEQAVQGLTAIKTVPISVEAANTTVIGDYNLQLVQGVVYEVPAVRVTVEIVPSAGGQNATRN